MSGTVFKESSNIYQDQAKVLFDYYMQAAELIVGQEMDLEQAIKKAQDEFATMQTDYDSEIERQKQVIKQYTTWMYILFITLIGGLIMLLIINKNLKPKLEKFIEASNENLNSKRRQIDELKRRHADIKRDYQVSKLGVVYVPVASHIPFEDKNFVIDFTGSVTEIPFTLSSIKQPDAIKRNVDSLIELINNVPLVETSKEIEVIDTSEYSTSMQETPLYDFMGGVDRHMRNLGFLLRDVNRVSVSLPIVTPKSTEYQFLKKHGTTDPGNSPICKIFDMDSFNANISTFEQLNDMKKSLDSTSGEFVDFFKTLMTQLAESAQILIQMKVNCTGKIMDFSNTMFMNTLRTSFNHYSPVLEAEEIERIRAANFNYQEIGDSYTPFVLSPSSRMKYDLISKNWVADDGSRSSYPFGMHQIHEEIMMPIIHNLMEETRIERLKIYNHIKDQKLDYLNQWHRDTEDFYARNRAESNDLINRMRETFAEYSSSLNTLKALQETEKQMGAAGTLDSTKVEAKSNQAETLATFELQGNQFMQQQEEFMDYMDRLKEDIDIQAEKFGYIECFEASLRDDEARKLARATQELQDLDPRRKKLAGAGAHFATMTEIPPEPQIEAKTYDDFTINLIKMADDALHNLENPVQEDAAESKTEDQPSIAVESQPPLAEDNVPEPRDNTSPPDAETTPKAEQQVDAKPEVTITTPASYSVILNSLGDRQDVVILAISEIIDQSPEDVTEMVSKLPAVLVCGWNLEDASLFFDELDQLGASAEIQREG